MSMNILSKCMWREVFQVCHMKAHVPPCVSSVRTLLRIYEPDYLEKLKPEIPEHPSLTIELKGYDFPVLESYQQFIHKIAENMEIEVEDGWALPPEHWKVTKLRPESSIVESEYLLRKYQRFIQINDVPTTYLSVLMELLQAALPAGVSLQIMEHQPEHDEIRYVPDHTLEQLKAELEELGGPSKKK